MTRLSKRFILVKYAGDFFFFLIIIKLALILLTAIIVQVHNPALTL